MTPHVLYDHLIQLGCTLSLDGSTLNVRPRKLLTPDLIALITQYKPALIALLTPSEIADDPGPRGFHSTVLDADFWVCQSPADGAALRAEGAVAYTAEEIWQLQALKAHDPESFPAKLKVIHDNKAVWGCEVEEIVYATTRDSDV